jgi:two-component system, OmpR family, phosphate regulon sensor histidine kinase PhoR
MELYFVIALLFIILLWMSWRYISLRRKIETYAQTLRHAASTAQETPPNLPTDIKDLESLSNAARALSISLQNARQQAETEQTRIISVLDQLTDGVILADELGSVRFLNPAAERLFQTTRPQALGRSVTEILRHHQLVETWQKCQQRNQLQSETVELSARRQYIQLIAIPDNQQRGSILLVQNLTRLRRLETVRRDFISNISHELRTPLASLKALTETLQEGALEDPSAARRFLKRIEAEVDALTQMATELLDLSRIESGQVALDLAPVTPNKIVQAAAERMRLQAERAGLTLHIICDENLGEIHADAPRLEQVLVNLIHNAVKFTDKGGEISLCAVAGEGSSVLFSVKDSGAGISSEDLPRIFERFYKSDRARTRGAGTGLGLSIARHIVEAHGGKIWAESVEGRGSTFYFSIPV